MDPNTEARHQWFCEAIGREGRALAAAARLATPAATVPTCPGWTVGELLRHQGRLHRWVTILAERRPNAEPEYWNGIEQPGDDTIVDWYSAGVEPCAAALAAAGPDEPMWSWGADATAGFWARRQAHETAVHRYDAQLAAGKPEAVEAELAADGIQELFDLLPYRRDAEARRGEGETIHIHCTDCDGEWLVRLDPDGAKVSCEHAKGDVAARGPASDLFLLVWNRLPVGAVEVFGDRALLERWLTLTRF